jgi:hypothetical protein
MADLAATLVAIRHDHADLTEGERAAERYYGYTVWDLLERVADEAHELAAEPASRATHTDRGCA